MSIFEIRDLDVEYRRPGRSPLRAVVGANLSVERGEIVGLVGETGCGKSSLARAACGLAAPTGGTVTLEGVPLHPIGRGRRPVPERKVQMVFQNPFSSLNPRRKIGDQIADGIRTLSGAARVARVGELLDQVGLSSQAAQRYPHEYSGGQRQRIAIARALGPAPSVIVLDEPLSSLDASAQAQIANLLRQLVRELNVAILLISHDLAIVRGIADVVAVMYLARIVEVGRTVELWADPLHPYTKALIAAIPLADGMGTRPNALPGEVPDPAQPPTGCRFHPRCPAVFAPCPVEEPMLVPIVSPPSRRPAPPAGVEPPSTAVPPSTRLAACWLHDPSRALAAAGERRA